MSADNLKAVLDSVWYLDEDFEDTLDIVDGDGGFVGTLWDASPDSPMGGKVNLPELRLLAEHICQVHNDARPDRGTPADLVKQFRRLESQLVETINTFESANDNNPNLRCRPLDLSSDKAHLQEVRRKIAHFEELAKQPVDPDARRNREQCQAAAPRLLNACEAVLMFFTNVNAIDPGEMVAKLLTSMEAAGYSRDELDAAAVALLRGAARHFEGADLESIRETDEIKEACLRQRRPSESDAAARTPEPPEPPTLSETEDLLGLVMEDLPDLSALTEEERNQVCDWAGLCHLEAGDNDDVEPGPAPACLRALLPEGHYLHTWRMPKADDDVKDQG